MKWFLLVWQRFAEFNGRSRRTEYWMFTLFNILIFLFLYLAGTALALVHQPIVGALMYILYFAYALAALIPSLACAVRRLHDTDKSGWLLLLGLVPIANIVLIVILALDGTPGTNRYGPDPKARELPAAIG